MDLHDLLAGNLEHVKKQLDQCKQYNGAHWKCKDIFEILSDSVACDQRMVNAYDETEIVVSDIPSSNGAVRRCRLFTRKGLVRYIHEGKITEYENACIWLGEQPRNKLVEVVRGMLSVETRSFKTRQILKWLFQRRKYDKLLGENVSCNTLWNWMQLYKDQIDQDRFSAIEHFVDKK